MVIFAEQGQLVSTVHGLSIVMTNGSLNISGNGNVTGTFDNFDMDLSINEKKANYSSRVRSLSTKSLLKSLREDLTKKQRKSATAELCTRFLSPIMNLILAALCLTVLLRSSLLRRRTSFAPAVAVVMMSVIMATFMSLSGMVTNTRELILLFSGQMVVLTLIMVVLFKK